MDDHERPPSKVIAGAAVVPLDDPLGVARVDPEAVIVAVRRRDRLETLAAIDRLPAVERQYPDRVRVLRIGVNVHVVPRAAAEVRAVANALPGLAVVVRAKERTVFRLDECPDAPRLRRRGRDADLAEYAGSAGRCCA